MELTMENLEEKTEEKQNSRGSEQSEAESRHNTEKSKQDSNPKKSPRKRNATENIERDSSGSEVYPRQNPIRERGRTYIVTRADGGAKEITNFVMRPLKSIKSEYASIMDMEFSMQDGEVFEQQLDSSAFISKQQFNRAIKKIGGIDMVFSGSDDDLANIQKYITNKYQGYNHCIGIGYVGLYKQKGGGWIYVGSDGAINRKGKPLDSIVSVLEDNEALRSTIIDAEMPKRQDLLDIAGKLFSFNTYERTINIIGWIGACFLKERLRQRKIKLSHLVIAGGAGSGKSETLEKIIQPIFGLQGSGIGCSGLTKFSTLKSTSGTNLLPVIFEEYKPHKLSKIELDLISATLRSTYDYQTSQRGEPTSRL